MRPVQEFEPPLKNQSNDAYTNPVHIAALVKVEDLDIARILAACEADA
jgi:hypothetical protein